MNRLREIEFLRVWRGSRDCIDERNGDISFSNIKMTISFLSFNFRIGNYFVRIV